MTAPAGTWRTHPVRAAVLVDHPSQHIAPGLRLLTERVEIRPRVYYWNPATRGVYDRGFGRHVRWNVDLHSGYDWWAPPTGASAGRRWMAAWRKLHRDRPDVVLTFGWASPIARVGIAYSTVTRTPLLYYGDTNGHVEPTTWRHRLRGLVLRRLFRRAAGAVSTGAFNRDFYLAHGLPPELVYPGVLPANVTLFHSVAAPRRRLRDQEGAERALVIGFAGKFTSVKGVPDMVDAVARLPRDRPWKLHLIGDGPLRPQLESAVAQRDLTERVHFLGFRNADELPALMSEIDIMVMPSRKEPRGLVAIEAMAAGAAVVVSSATGLWGPGDVIQHRRTGVVFPAGDVEALATCIRELLGDPGLRTCLATAGQAQSLSFGPADFASTVGDALLATIRGNSDGG
ncbi:glycosyltransferase family 4 protein [Phytoactinopolyspora halotolerans]|uniref:Glycosyltransferase family 4 protein n=1 Tax=Phytoactinopolyspora halotolerans TaxID=1981512 RepID=A0A6L9S608_9ACTN|nr:glycosyltransferase family 4 protein [Phytoactinopolyspora halotolerans]NEE00181.1 glycosyltransferase family 4 protein [Phytoactinopolyspora halotolerans]